MMFDCVAAHERAGTSGWALALPLSGQTAVEKPNQPMPCWLSQRLSQTGFDVYCPWRASLDQSAQCRYGLACAYCVSVAEIERTGYQAARRQFGRSIR